MSIYNNFIDEWTFNLDFPIADFGAKIPANPELAVDVLEAKEMIKVKDADIVCVRIWPEYIGEVSGYNYIEKKGRIPGAIFGNCGSDAYHMEKPHIYRQRAISAFFYQNWHVFLSQIDHITNKYTLALNCRFYIINYIFGYQTIQAFLYHIYDT